MRIIHVAVAAAGLALAAGCASPSATYDERMAYLRKVAQQGADTHSLLAGQEAVIDAKRCGEAWAGLARPDEFPDDTSNGTGPSKVWTDQIRQFFVDSCISGKAKPVPGGPAQLTTTTTTTTTEPTTMTSVSPTETSAHQ